MRVLVTGAAGFVGETIIKTLLDKNFEVIGLGSPKSENKNNLANFFKADIVDPDSLKPLEKLENLDAIIHTAGLAHRFGKVEDELFRRVNVVGTKNIAFLGARLEIKHFVLISSVSVYGRIIKNTDSEAVGEDSMCQPESVYARSKYDSESEARAICEKNRIPLTILRPATVIGEDDRGNTSRLIEMIDKGRFFWIGKGENLKSLIYKNDVAEACLSVLEKRRTETEVFNVTAAPVKMKEIVAVIARSLNKTIPGIYLPPGILKSIFRLNEKTIRLGKLSKLSETFDKWVSNDAFSGEKIAAKYGFRASTPVSEALKRQVEAYKNQK